MINGDNMVSLSGDRSELQRQSRDGRRRRPDGTSTTPSKKTGKPVETAVTVCVDEGPGPLESLPQPGAPAANRIISPSRSHTRRRMLPGNAATARPSIANAIHNDKPAPRTAL